MEFTKKQNIFNEFIKLPNYLYTSFFFWGMFLLLIILFFPYQKEKIIYAENTSGIVSFYCNDIDFIYEDSLYINKQKNSFEIIKVEKDLVNKISIVRIKLKQELTNKIIKLTFRSKKTTLIKEIIYLLKKGIIT